MLRTSRHLRRSLMALAAVFAASFAASDASACSSMKSGGAACATVCGCCLPSANDAPAAAPLAPLACEASANEGCVCRTDQPAAPNQKPSRTAEDRRTELNPGLDFVQPGDDAAARPKAGRVAVPTHAPPKIPLYLRNARLLF